ncbi:MAG: metal transporter [Acidobacteriota bacterium]|nr:metal transporter [Acidobacteriota bacterium]
MTAEIPNPIGRLCLIALAPLVLLGVLLVVIIQTWPGDAIGVSQHPPVEELSFSAAKLRPNEISLSVFNDGPDTVTISQIQVDDAYWAFTSDVGTILSHLQSARLTIPYPWVEGEQHTVRVVTSTGATFDHEISVAVETPQPDLRYFFAFTLIGTYVGVIPVAIGLLWFPLVARLGRTGLAFLLSLTVGLLLFLMVDAGQEGLEMALVLPESYQGVMLFGFGVFGAYFGLELVGGWLREKRQATATSGWALALLVAIGIGLHNFGEGLAIGAAFALGEAGLGTLLIVGFTLHNTTEGLAIVAPLARDRAKIGQLVKLGVVGGAPTIAGAWLGGLVYSPLWAVMFLGIGVGAIAQVVIQIVRQLVPDGPVMRFMSTAPALSGLSVGFVLMYATGMLVG